MKTENIAFILERLKFLGFGDKLGIPDRLKEAIKEDPLDIQLDSDVFFGQSCRMEVSLYFRRSEQRMTYFFNKYVARIYYIDQASKNKCQTFYIEKGRGITLREAYNLLQGRAVNKNMRTAGGELYNAWVQLDFSEMTPDGNYKMVRYNSNYGFDLEKTLEKYPIRELRVSALREALLKSLKRGNLHPVTLVKSNKIEQWLLEAVPKFKMIKLHPGGEDQEFEPADADNLAMAGMQPCVEEPSLPWEPEAGMVEDEEEEPSEVPPDIKEERVDKDEEAGMAAPEEEDLLFKQPASKRARKPIKVRK